LSLTSVIVLCAGSIYLQWPTGFFILAQREIGTDFLRRFGNFQEGLASP
jgi:hypothetical protein